ncbi:MAG: DUF1302 family protein [Stagnimonas sp.]|nr:DUF1302 family protein [Stagnimonas sp.]
MRRLTTVTMILLLARAGSCWSDELQWQWGGFNAELSGLYTIGAAWRMQQRSNELIGKLNVPGQQELCLADDCMSASGDLEPNQRLIDAVGAFAGSNNDNGNLNYERYDLVAATTRLTPQLILDWGPLSAKLRGLFYYDPVNDDFDDRHSNTLYQPARTPRARNIAEDFGRGYKWLDAYVTGSFGLGSDRELALTVGNQVLNWGESNLTLFNTLNAFNPLDATVARMPGFQLNEVARPVPAALLAGDIGGHWSFEALYQLQWVPVLPDQAGSFFSTSDLLGDGRYLMTGIGQFAEDPERQYSPPGFPGLISQSTRTAYMLPADHGYPRDGGQYGLQLKYYAADLNGGTELGLYFLNYHSRLPYVSVYAAQQSCTRDAGSNDFLAVFAACEGFNASFNPVGLEPLPVDSVQPYFAYPENLRMFGLSLSTNLGRWSLGVEYSYRPNLPLQVQLTDILFAAEAPALPEEDVAIPADLAGQALFTLPGYQRAYPSFLPAYRGIEQYRARELVPGYERFPVGQLVLSGLRSWGNSNLFGADQITMALEFGLSHIVGLPSLSRLQLEGQGDRTHHSPGADGSGDPNGEADSLRVNPTQQTSGFATELAYGYRGLLRLSYTGLPAGLRLNPTLVLLHDLHGISPAQIDNYVAGRITGIVVLDAELGQHLGAGLQYQVFTGAGQRNARRDRDNLSFSLRYSF